MFVFISSFVLFIFFMCLLVSFFLLTRQKNSSYAIDVTAFKEFFGRVTLFAVFKMMGIL